MRAGRPGRRDEHAQARSGRLRRDRGVRDERAEPARLRLDRRGDAGGCVAPRLHLRASQLRPERVGLGRVRRRPRRIDARHGARRPVRGRQGLGFVAGISLVFELLGAAASAVGHLLRDYQVWLGRAGGVLSILFGIYLLGVFRPALLMREWRIQLAHKPLGYFGSAVVGFTFGAAWTPCIGPILGGILTLAATEAGLGRGMGLLAIYALGLAIPFLVTALALDR